MRRFLQDCWEKFRQQQELSPLEALVAGVIADHPEYHDLVESGEDALAKDFTPEDGQANPFLHMGMHITIREQVQANRPAGIRDIHQSLSRQYGDPHEAEHRMQECLGLILWEAQRANRLPDEEKYLQCLRDLGNKASAT